MRIYPGLFSAVGKLANGAVAIGNFDGVHLGRRASAPALCSVALRDQTCPPSPVFA
ncbi:acetylxylan esterase, partial [Listeria monocytogenes]|nr:acetylxylan esterase [Listeria monocytogenes]